MSLGLTEILVIILVIVLLFGAKRIPQLARSLGTSLREFKEGKRSREIEDKKTEIE